LLRASDVDARGLSRHDDVMRTRTTPESGDIVVQEERRGKTPVYYLRVAFGTAPFEFREREEGIARALLLGERQHVCVWLTDEGCGFLLLEDFRTVDSR
jgi:hypothetical protein